MARRRDDDDDYDDDDDRKRDDDDDDDDDRPRKKSKKRSKGGPSMGEYLFFSKVIGPPLVMVIFWLGVVCCVFQVIMYIIALAREGPPPEMARLGGALAGPSKFETTMYLLFYLFVAPVILRGFCEGLVCLMRIADSLQAQKTEMPKDEAPAKKESPKDDEDEDDEEDEE
jgi:Transmembrane domain of transglycosylase PBP1 at N-terminal